LRSILILLLISFTSKAQEVVICEKFSNTGIPKNTILEIAVDSLPFNAKVLYNNGKTTIERSKVNILVEAEDGMKVTAEAFFINVSQSRNWVGADIQFKYPGSFVVSAFTPENSVLASTRFSVLLNGMTTKVDAPRKKEGNVEKVINDPVEVKTEVGVSNMEATNEEPQEVEEIATGFDPDHKVTISSEEDKTLYYKEVQLEFGTSRNENELVGKNKMFNLKLGRADVTGMLMNGQKLNTSSLQIDTWQKGNNGSFSELIVSEEHVCDPNAKTSFFPLRFYREGQYKVSVYTKDFVWIASAYVTVIKP